ncbi:hypothetical protein IKZ77_00725 [Candidatus Saccharibacteria bacterium]|nr:hypothetical protein [Candidatus Saccharibacteria bacterium]
MKNIKTSSQSPDKLNPELVNLLNSKYGIPLASFAVFFAFSMISLRGSSFSTHDLKFSESPISSPRLIQ